MMIGDGGDEGDGDGYRVDGYDDGDDDYDFDDDVRDDDENHYQQESR